MGKVTDAYCTLKVKEANNQYAVERSVGQTEVKKNETNPTWTDHFKVVYQFNKDRELFFQLWNKNDFAPKSKELIGEVFCKLTDIMMGEG